MACATAQENPQVKATKHQNIKVNKLETLDVGVKRLGKSERIIMALDDDGWDDGKGYETSRL